MHTAQCYVNSINSKRNIVMKQLIFGLLATLALSTTSYAQIERGATTINPKDSVTIQVFEEIEESCQINYKDLRLQVLNSKKIILKQQRCEPLMNNIGLRVGFMGKITIIR